MDIDEYVTNSGIYYAIAESHDMDTLYHIERHGFIDVTSFQED